jgi:hypothetical protein
MFHGTTSDRLIKFTEKVIWKKANGLLVVGYWTLQQAQCEDVTLHGTGQPGVLNPACYFKGNEKCTV